MFKPLNCFPIQWFKQYLGYMYKYYCQSPFFVNNFELVLKASDQFHLAYAKHVTLRIHANLFILFDFFSLHSYPKVNIALFNLLGFVVTANLKH